MNDSNSAESSKRDSVNLKLIMAVAAVAVIAAFAICIIGSADDSDADTEWKIGTPTDSDVVASYNTGTKELTISGTGAMINWNSDEVPWVDYIGELETVIIGDNITNVGKDAFYGCSKLANVTLGKDITLIDQYAFAYCSSLTAIDLVSGINSIGGYAFKGTGLTSLTIPNSVNTIGSMVFANCASLKTLIIGSGLEKIEQSAFRETGLTSVEIPNTVGTIGAYSFYKCASLTTVNFGSGVTTIGYSAFEETGLTSLTIPNNVGTIAESAFEKCKSLTAVDLGSGVTTISKNAFGETGLTSITIPAQVTNIHPLAFCQSSLKAYAVDSGNSNYSAESGVLFNKNKTALVSYPAKGSNSYSIPDSVSTVEKYAFAYTLIDTIHFGKNVTTIGNYAFQSTAITSMVIPDGVTTIGQSAFIACASLSSVTIPNSVTTIGSKAFNECAALATVSVYATDPVTAIGCGSNAFGSITFKNGDDTIDINSVSFPGHVYHADSGTVLSNVGDLKKWDISATENDSVIADYNGYTKTLTISGTGAMEDWAGTSGSRSPWREAGYSNNITALVIEEGVTNIGSYAFNNNNGVLKTISISEGVVSIGERSLSGTGLKEVYIPSTVAAIDSTAFNSSRSIEEYTVSDDNNDYSSSDGVLFSKNKKTLVCYPVAKEGNSYSVPAGVETIGDYAFLWCTSLASVTIPDSVNTIGISAFQNCKFTSITIPEDVTTIKESAFNTCDKLTSVTIPEGVNTIEKSTFSSCSALTSVFIPSSVTSIGEKAFTYCTSLASVTVANVNPPALDSTAFDNCTALSEILVPSGSVGSYKAATNWSSFAGKIFAGITLCTVDDIADQEYTGSQITPVVTVKNGTETLVLDTAYTVEYGDNVDIGKGTVTITGIGDYRGTVKKTFNIVGIESKITVTKTSSCPSKSYNVGATVTSGATMTYEVVTGSDIISVDPSTGLITPKAVGVAKLKISAPATETYKAAELTVDITVYDHIHVIVPGKAPTKTETGLTEGEICSECETVFTEQKSIPATGTEKSVIESENNNVKYAVPKSDDIKTLTVKLDDSKYTIELTEESTTKVKDTVIVFSIEEVVGTDDRYSAVMTSNGTDFTGTMNITLPYDPSKGTPSVKWVEGNEKMDTVKVNESDKTVTFTTTHNSTYEVEYQKCDNTVNGIIIGVVMIAAIAVLGLLATFIFVRKQ